MAKTIVLPSSEQYKRPLGLTALLKVLASVCCLRVKTWENVGKICGSARGEYGLSTDLGARRHAVEILVHAELLLRSGYGVTPSTDPRTITWKSHGDRTF